MNADWIGRATRAGAMWFRRENAAEAEPPGRDSPWDNGCETACHAAHDDCRRGCAATDGECQDACNHRRKRCRLDCRRQSGAVGIVS